MSNISRRRFLQDISMAAAMVPSVSPLAVPAQTSIPSEGLQGWITSGIDRCKPIALPGWQKTSVSSPDTIVIDHTKRFQSILGFGGAFTDASCYLFGRMKPEARRHLLDELLGPSGLCLSVGRTCIGSSDYSRSAYSLDDSSTPDPELNKFSIEHDEAYILPSLREARQVNPDLFLLGSPWSPPGWMKSSNTLLGGTMYKKYMGAYAQYFVRFLESYRKAGIPISAVTCQNEVDTNQDGRMPACLWGQEYETEFIRDHLSPALRKASLDTRIWLLDHNYDLSGRVLDQLNDPSLAGCVDGIAWHGYVGTPDAMTRVHTAYPEKYCYWTEGGDFYDNPDYLTNWTKWSATFTGILRNWARCIITWNLILDEKGQPNIGPFNCGGLITQNSKTGEIVRSGLYWAMAHYSRLVRRDAKVIDTSASIEGVEHVAFLNPDGDYVLVLTNRDEQRTMWDPLESTCRHASLSIL